MMCDPSASCVMHNIHLENEQNELIQNLFYVAAVYNT